jgi:hypothetical protein
VVVLVEVARKAYLASMVPVIVNAILNEHQTIVDIVAFVNKGEFPRSRLGEKQRGKILAGWVTRKMRTIAQFAIRDAAPMPGEAVGGETTDLNRASVGSQRSSGVPAAGSSSLRNVEHAPQILEQEELDQQMGRMAAIPPAEMPADDQRASYGSAGGEAQGLGGAPQGRGLQLVDHGSQGYGSGGYDGRYDDDQDDSPPAVGPKPGATPSMGGYHGAPQLRLPGVDGRESMDEWRSGGGGGRDEEDWTTDAIMHMNLASDMERRQNQGGA